jgi:hypothetical protein
MKREERVKQLKCIAQEISDRADDLIGDNECVMGYEINVRIFPKECPEIELRKRIFPHKLMEENLIE